MVVRRVALENFREYSSSLTELSSVALGGQIVSVSDEFFAEAHHLLLVESAPSMKGQFGPNGALYSGWESRRHNPTYDWCVIRLGTAGILTGFDVDTTHFNGNEAPQVSVHALYNHTPEDPLHDDPRWVEIVPKVDIGPNSRHLFEVDPAITSFNYVKVHMYPDGGIARFRAYGKVTPVQPSDRTSFDLAHVFAGGRVIQVSDQHFGVGANLILPGRGKNMGDGWETKRSRRKGHKDWVVIQLGAPGELEQVELDTNHFLGNFPESCEIEALCDDQGVDWKTNQIDDCIWSSILPRTKLGPNRQHYFELENAEGRVFTHVKVTIYPDGGLKRIRIIGRKTEVPVESTTTTPTSLSNRSISPFPSQVMIIPVTPLKGEDFAPFGQVIQAYGQSTNPKRVKVTPANAGTANKFHKLSLLSSSYPSEAGATTGISVYRCQPLQDITDGCTMLRTLERHPHTTQSFIPMARDPENRYLVVVAHNGVDDKPDLQTVKGFLATAGQGISYNLGIWHQPMTVLGKGLDLACVETQIGDGSSIDCEIIELGNTCLLKFD